MLVARNDLSAHNLQQFISYAKANHGNLHYSSSGIGGSNHLACMLLNSAIGVEATHVPYRNVVQGLQDVMAGRVDYDCVSLPLALPQIAAKTVKPIVVLSKSRSPSLPDLPSAHEQGLTDFDIPSWYALFRRYAASDRHKTEQCNVRHSTCRPCSSVPNRSGVM